MLDRIRPRLSYANVMSSIAVFVVLGGGAYATIDRKIGTSDLRKGAVTTPKIKKQAVKAGKLAANSVRTPKVFDGAITTSKLAEQAVTGDKIGDLAVGTLKLADGAVSTEKLGDEAVTTGKIASQAVSSGRLGDGAVTASKLSQVIVRSNIVPLNDNSSASALATCEEGERLIGGGGNVGAFPANSDDLFWLSSRPATAAGGIPGDGTELTHWRSSARNFAGGIGNTNLRAYALCLS